MFSAVQWPYIVRAVAIYEIKVRLMRTVLRFAFMSDADMHRLAGESLADIRTVRKAYAGLLRRGLVYARIAAAAQRLGLPVPPEPQPRGA